MYVLHLIAECCLIQGHDRLSCTWTCVVEEDVMTSGRRYLCLSNGLADQGHQPWQGLEWSMHHEPRSSALTAWH